MDNRAICECGHAAYWHGDQDRGVCEHDGECSCRAFRHKDGPVGPRLSEMVAALELELAEVRRQHDEQAVRFAELGRKLYRRGYHAGRAAALRGAPVTTAPERHARPLPVREWLSTTETVEVLEMLDMRLSQ